MLKKSVVAMAAALLAACIVGPAVADVVCQDSSYCEVVFNRTYPPESQFSGQPYDYVTVAPNGAGETFTEANGIPDGDGLADIEIRVYLRNCSGEPLQGIPAQQVQLFSNALCICPGGADSDLGTDDQGIATFTGSLSAGGCASSIDVYADGVFICTLQDNGARTVKINSTDQAHTLTSPCFTDASDLAGFASVFGTPASNPGNVCFDYNERGVNIDASDLAGFASQLGAACQ